MKEEKKRSESSDKENVYVVDTNVIINDPNFIKKLRGKILIPTTVLQELDKHKYGPTEKARNTREFARFIDRNSNSVWFHDSDEYEGSNDDKIIKTALSLKKQGHNVTLVTNDILMGLIAKSVKLNVKKHRVDREEHYRLYSGIKDLKFNGESDNSKVSRPIPNEYQIHDDGLYRTLPSGKLKKLGRDMTLWGVTHKNVEQKCAIDALMNDDIKLVTLSGRAGTGKTLLALVCALEKVVTENQYLQLMVSRPVIPMGKEIGFLPGDLEEKLSPWMQPIFDNVDFLFNSKGNKGFNHWQNLVDEGILKLEALSYIRGRSIPDQFIIIDEAQNLSSHEIKTIISRAGVNTKIILTGDVMQIDNPKLDSGNNGLTYVIERFKYQKIAAHINLTKCERSELAEIATEIL